VLFLAVEEKLRAVTELSYSSLVFVAVYTKNAMHTYEGLVGPLIQRLEHRLSDLQRDLAQLSEENEQMKEELKKSKLRSPVRFTTV